MTKEEAIKILEYHKKGIKVLFKSKKVREVKEVLGVILGILEETDEAIDIERSNPNDFRFVRTKPRFG